MDYHVQVKYAKLAGSSIERFKVKKHSPFMASGRCPVCGDSAKSKTKTRFVIYEKNKDLNVTCFNCGLSTTLFGFLKSNNRPLFDEWIFETYKSNKKIETDTLEDFVPEKIEPIILKKELDLEMVADLPIDHPAVEYVQSRRLPDYPFQFTPKFLEFSKQYKNELEPGNRDGPRLIIPFFDRKGNIYAYQGRDLTGQSKLKYITISIDKKMPKIFGLDRVDIKKPILLVEGPLDSLFLPNCLASVNANLSATAKRLVTGLNLEPTNLTLVLDNEPRNKTILDQYEKAIANGFRIVIWPKTVTQKDVNDMVLAGLDPLNIIMKNTYSGLLAKLQLNSWRKV